MKSDEEKAERAEAELHLAEAMRMTNEIIRRATKVGLDVEATILTLHTVDGPVPQINFGTVERSKSAD